MGVVRWPCNLYSVPSFIRGTETHTAGRGDLLALLDGTRCNDRSGGVVYRSGNATLVLADAGVTIHKRPWKSHSIIS